MFYFEVAAKKGDKYYLLNNKDQILYEKEIELTDTDEHFRILEETGNDDKSADKYGVAQIITPKVSMKNQT